MDTRDPSASTDRGDVPTTGTDRATETPSSDGRAMWARQRREQKGETRPREPELFELPPNGIPVFLRQPNFSKFTRYLGPRAQAAHEKVETLEERRPGHGVELFESPEHEALGDYAATLLLYEGAPVPNSFNLYYVSNLNFGQIMALAGDFFAANPISDGHDLPTRKTLFMNAFNDLYDAPASVVNNVLAVMDQQAAEVAAIVGRWQSPIPDNAYAIAYSQANADNKYDKLYNAATGGFGSGLWFAGPGAGQYIDLAKTNWDHFGQNAVLAYQAGHACVLDLAASAPANETEAQRRQRFNKVCTMEAFACHYLTDLFSSGHLRTPREALGLEDSSAANPCAQLMHDEDSYNGLKVSNALGATWIAFGDKRYFDTPNATNASQAKSALACTIGELNTVFAGGATPASYSALQVIPDLTIVQRPRNRDNWSPLFILDGSMVKRRTSTNDLLDYEWTWWFFYSFTWASMPAGGTHSLFGAPPGVTSNALPLGILEPGTATLHAGGSTLTARYVAAVLAADPAATPDSNGVTFPRLHLITRNGTALRHISTSMSNAPLFGAACDIDEAVPRLSPPCGGGEASLLSLEGGFLLVYPDDTGMLWQTTYDCRTTTPQWGSPTIALAAGSAKMKSGSRAALCRIGDVTAIAYRDVNGNLTVAQGLLSKTATGVVCQWEASQGLLIAGKAVYAAGDPSLIEYDDGLMLAYEAPSFIGIGLGITVLVNPISAGRPTQWSTYDVSASAPAGLMNGVYSGNAMSLVANGGQWAIVANAPSNGELYLAYDRTTWTQGSQPTSVPITAAKQWTLASLGHKTNWGIAVLMSAGSPFVVFSDASNSNALTVLANQPPADTNLALHKSATASSSQKGHSPGAGNDGDTNTYWSAANANAGAWWQVDLGKPYVLAGTTVTWAKSDNAYQYRIDVSTDNSTWTPCIDNTRNSTAAKSNSDDFVATARYVRITITGGLDASHWASFQEFAAFGHAPRATTNLALNKTASADQSQSGHPPSAGNDGSTTTRWCAPDANTGHHWTVDLGKTYALQRIHILWEQAAAYQYVIDASPDGSSWHTIFDNQSNTTAKQTSDILLSDTGRYVRITITGGLGSGTWASFYEFEVYGR